MRQSEARDANFKPVRFIASEIEVCFQHKPHLEKTPQAPDYFTWDETGYSVVEVLSEWHSFERRGRMAFNMKTPHLKEASRRGSWGVGRFYFRVQTDSGRIFDLYFDRAPEAVQDRKGHWFLWRELQLEG